MNNDKVHDGLEIFLVESFQTSDPENILFLFVLFIFFLVSLRTSTSKLNFLNVGIFVFSKH